MESETVLITLGKECRAEGKGSKDRLPKESIGRMQFAPVGLEMIIDSRLDSFRKQGTCNMNILQRLSR